MDGGLNTDYAAYDSHDGGAAYAFIETQPQVRRAQQTLQPPPPTEQPVMQVQPQKQQQPPQQHQQPQPQYEQNLQQQIQVQDGYSGALSSSQADADRQALFFRMQENLQMQQDMQRSSWTDRCWQKRRDVIKLVIMALVILLALSTHSVLVFYIKTYVEEASLSDWKEFFFRVAYPTSVLLVIWAIKGSQARSGNLSPVS